MIKFNNLNQEKPYVILKKNMMRLCMQVKKILRLFQYHLITPKNMKLIQGM